MMEKEAWGRGEEADSHTIHCDCPFCSTIVFLGSPPPSIVLVGEKR